MRSTSRKSVKGKAKTASRKATKAKPAKQVTAKKPAARKAPTKKAVASIESLGSAGEVTIFAETGDANAKKEENWYDPIVKYIKDVWDSATKKGVDPERCRQIKDAGEQCKCINEETNKAVENRGTLNRAITRESDDFVDWTGRLYNGHPNQPYVRRRVEGHKQILDRLKKEKEENDRKIDELRKMHRQHTNADIQQLHVAAKQGWNAYATAIWKFGQKRYQAAKQINSANRARYRVVRARYTELGDGIAETNRATGNASSVSAFSSASALGAEPKELK